MYNLYMCVCVCGEGEGGLLVDKLATVISCLHQIKA